MKYVKHTLGSTIAALLAVFILAFPVLACLPPGESPGYWKHQVVAYVEEQGAIHEPDIVGLTAEINYYWSLGPPLPWPWLPMVPDTNGDGVFTIMDAYAIFTDKAYKTYWLALADYYNGVSGRAPYSGG